MKAAYELSDKIEKGEVDVDEPDLPRVEVEESAPFVSKRKFGTMNYKIRNERATS